MPLWRCPHCGTPQAESSRCWVCRRSTTSCAACRHFRRGVAGGLGLCGLDPRRLALRGTEMRACWEAADATGAQDAPEDGPPALVPVPATALPVAAGSGSRRTFVPVESLSPRADGSGRPGDAEAAHGPYPGVAVMPAGDDRVWPPAIPARRIPGRWSLWGDFEP